MSRYIPQLLPYVWLAILVALSAEILNAKPVRDRLLGVYSRWGVGDKMMTYVIISLLGAGLLSLYWWSIGKTFAVLEQQKSVDTLINIKELKPNIEVKFVPNPVPYRYPKKGYSFSVFNTNQKSVSITDLRIEFIFKDTVIQANVMPLIETGNPLGEVQGAQTSKGTEKGSELVYEDQPIFAGKGYSLIIEQAKTEGKLFNKNSVMFTCDKWPEKAVFVSDVVTDSSAEYRARKGPTETYHGIYFYEIDGRKFEKKIKGHIPKD